MVVQHGECNSCHQTVCLERITTAHFMWHLLYLNFNKLKNIRWAKTELWIFSSHTVMGHSAHNGAWWHEGEGASKTKPRISELCWVWGRGNIEEIIGSEFWKGLQLRKNFIFYPKGKRAPFCNLSLELNTDHLQILALPHATDPDIWITAKHQENPLHFYYRVFVRMQRTPCKGWGTALQNRPCAFSIILWS